MPVSDIFVRQNSRKCILSKFADSVIIIKTFNSFGELLSSLETTNFYISASELLVTSEIGKQVFKYRKHENWYR